VRTTRPGRIPQPHPRDPVDAVVGANVRGCRTHTVRVDQQ
jgi:hypothetical protein